MNGIIIVLSKTDTLINFLVMCIPLLFGLWFAKRYNFIHGIVGFIFMTVLILGVIQGSGEIAKNFDGFVKPNENIEKYTSYFTALIYTPIYGLFQTYDLLDFVKTDGWQLYTFTFVPFLFLQIIASKMRRKRKDKYGI